MEQRAERCDNIFKNVDRCPCIKNINNDNTSSSNFSKVRYLGAIESGINNVKCERVE